eukprot:TRINITY_DN1589_c0_g1_i1.p1 TRINITY_DN1589_c0_g1~~TRINITY_DN1589_c0_g1_i1.p1  ORF type:complete len:578 (-),score=101.71 TRINITY_DN1589_c0_g1_i1:58-1791(-)
MGCCQSKPAPAAERQLEERPAESTTDQPASPEQSESKHESGATRPRKGTEIVVTPATSPGTSATPMSAAANAPSRRPSVSERHPPSPGHTSHSLSHDGSRSPESKVTHISASFSDRRSHIEGGHSPQSQPRGSSFLSPEDATLSRSHSPSGAAAAEGHVRTSESVVVTRDEQGRKVVNEYAMISKLGAGSFGKVKLAEHRVTHEKFAIKIMQRSKLMKRQLGKHADAYEDIQREIAILKKLNHPNVVTLFEVIDDHDSDKLYLVFEFVEKGAVMKSSNEQQTPLDEETVRRHMRDLILGLEYLHAQHIIHRDIKPENLLVGKDGRLKISDFGVAHISQGDHEAILRTAGSPAFLAPEICSGQPFLGPPIDVWAMGVTAFMMLFGHMPFTGETLLAIYDSIQHTEPVFPRTLSPALHKFLQSVLTKDPEKRATIAELKTDAWVTHSGTEPLTQPQVEKVEVSREEIRAAFTIRNALAQVARRISTAVKRARSDSTTLRASSLSRNDSGGFRTPSLSRHDSGGLRAEPHSSSPSREPSPQPSPLRSAVRDTIARSLSASSRQSSPPSPQVLRQQIPEDA